MITHKISAQSDISSKISKHYIFCFENMKTSKSRSLVSNLNFKNPDTESRANLSGINKFHCITQNTVHHSQVSGQFVPVVHRTINSVQLYFQAG